MTFSFTSAKQLLEDHHSSLKLATVSRHVALSPIYLGNVTNGIKEQLNSLVGVFSEAYQGVVIAYNNVKLQQRFGLILDDQPNIHFDIQVEMIIFQPTIGNILKGFVNKVSRDHIGCLVHNLFNASLPRSKEPNHYVTVGQSVLFQVVRTFTQNGILSISGQLVTESCEGTAAAASEKHKKRKRGEADDLPNEDAFGSPSFSVERKRRKVKAESLSAPIDTLSPIPNSANISFVSSKKNANLLNDSNTFDLQQHMPTDDCLIMSGSDISGDSHVRKHKRKSLSSSQREENVTSSNGAIIISEDEIAFNNGDIEEPVEYTSHIQKHAKAVCVDNNAFDADLTNMRSKHSNSKHNGHKSLHSIKREKE